MKKRDFITLVLAVIGGLCFAIGMCMCLLPEWNAFTPGVIVTARGALLLIILAVSLRKRSGKPAVKVNGKLVGIIVYGVCSALVLGVGMCLILVWGWMLWGILVGVVGILLLLGLLPMIKGFQ